jgi:hypothetical protein
MQKGRKKDGRTRHGIVEQGSTVQLFQEEGFLSHSTCTTFDYVTVI